MAALYLGEALLRTRSLARAASVLQHVLALDARSLMARLLLATVRQQAGQKLEAAEEFTRALDIDPANVAALVNSGTTLRELGKETEALARFESAVRVSPSTPGTNSSRMYSDLG
jgi:Tfp pilus assembly protein PilF